MIKIILYIFTVIVTSASSLYASGKALDVLAINDQNQLNQQSQIQNPCTWPKHLELAAFDAFLCTAPGQSGNVMLRLTTQQFEQWFNVFLWRTDVSVILDDSTQATS